MKVKKNNPRDQMIYKHIVYLVENDKISNREIIFKTGKKHENEIKKFRSCLQSIIEFMSEYDQAFDNKLYDLFGQYIHAITVRCSIIIAIYNDDHPVGWTTDAKNSIISVYNKNDSEECQEIINKIKKSKMEKNIKKKIIDIMKKLQKSIKQRSYIKIILTG
jgi:hypothetical protein